MDNTTVIKICEAIIAILREPANIGITPCGYHVREYPNMSEHEITLKLLRDGNFDCKHRMCGTCQNK